MRKSLVLFLTLAAGTVPVALRAQSTIDAAPPRVYIGGNGLVGHPQREFADNVPKSWGGSLNLITRLDRRSGIFALRFDGGLMGYGHESKEVPLSSTVGGRIRVNVNTDNVIGYLGVGPQLMAPGSGVRPYVAGTVGVAYFATTSSVSSSDGGEAFAHDTNYDDVNFAYRGIGGLYIPVSRGRVPVSLDLSAQYHNNGVASYLRKGDIHDNPDGTISFTPRRSEADLVSFHVGVTVGLPRGR